MTEPLKVLFVCTANICRSPFAELYVSARATTLGREILTDSAGIHGYPQAPVDSHMARELAARGVESADFSSKALRREHVEWADLIVTMENAHRTFLIEDYPRVARRIVTLGQLVNRAGELGVSGTDLVAGLARRPGLTKDSDDVSDPFRRGAEAAARCADRLTGLLDTALPYLAPPA